MYSANPDDVRERVLQMQRRAVRNAMFFGVSVDLMTDAAANEQADKVIRALRDLEYVVQRANAAETALHRKMAKLQDSLDQYAEGFAL